MHLLTVDELVPVERGRTMEPGRPYYVPNITAGMVLTDTRPLPCAAGGEKPLFRLARLTPAVWTPFDPSQDWNGRTIFLFRGGGFGDLLMLTPSIRELKRRWPDCKIKVVCNAEYRPVLEGLPVEWVAMPLPADEVGPEDAAVFFEGLIEYNPEADHVHAVDLFAQKLGIGPVEHRLDWKFHVEELVWATREYPRKSDWVDDGERLQKRVRIGIQVVASSPIRSYHPSLTSSLINLLTGAGYEVFLFGKKGQIACDVPGVTNLCDREMTFRQSVAVMAKCDAMVTPDSALFHVAQAIGVPVVALFGPFMASKRVTSGPALILEAQGECAPCFYHANETTQFPHDRPCSIAKFCTVLASITPRQIFEAVQDALAIWVSPQSPERKEPLPPV